MRVALGCDHAGLTLKTALLDVCRKLGHEVTDAGTTGLESVDYPDFALDVGRRVTGGSADLGILVCGTGLGMAMAAGKLRGVRAARCTTEFDARYARLHNDANVLCLGERVTGPGLAATIAEVFLSTAFEGGRHLRRVQKITAAEEG